MRAFDELAQDRTDRTAPARERSNEGRGLRLGQLAMLLGLSGFAVSQPLLAVAGENPALFTFAGVQGTDLVVFALVVALVPPLLLWAATVAAAAVDRKAGDRLFLVFASLLASAAAIQWVKSTGIEHGLVLGIAGLGAAVGFGAALVRVSAVSMWTRFTAPLPVFSVVLFLVASPAGDLLRSPTVAAGPAEGSDAVPVVFLLFDEFPLKTIIDGDRHIDAERFPNFARLASESTWYRDYTTMSHRTLQAVPSILSGRVPNSDGILWTNVPNNLFSLLADTHHLTVTETVTQLCGFTTCNLGGGAGSPGTGTLLSQMWGMWKQRVRLGPVDDIDLGQFAEDVASLSAASARVDKEADSIYAPGRVGAFLDALVPANEPHLYYLHMMLPHQPWTFFTDGRHYEGPTNWDLVDDDFGDWIYASLQQAHVWQAQYADRLLGEILDRLEASDLFDRALVVATSDHGVGFRRKNLRELDTKTLNRLAYVPLIIKSPGQTEGRIDDSNLMSIDVLPTIAQELGVTIDWEVDGYPAGSPQIEARGDAKQMYHFGNELATQPLQEIIEFRSADHTPRADRRLIPPSQPGEAAIQGLMQHLGTEQDLGLTIDDLSPTNGGKATLRRIADLRDPPTDTPVGWTRATVEDPSLGDAALLLVNGTVVTASPITESGEARFLLPPDTLDMDGGNEIAIVQKGPDGYYLTDLTT